MTTDANTVVLIISSFVFLFSLLWGIRQVIEIRNIKNNQLNSRRLMMASFNLCCYSKNPDYLEYQEWEMEKGFTPIGIYEKFFLDRDPTHNIDVMVLIPDDKWGNALKDEYITQLLNIK